MRLTKTVYRGEGGNSFQDLEMKIDIRWEQFEMDNVPVAVRNAIEAMIYIWQNGFEADSNYTFNIDQKRRPCLTINQRKKSATQLSLSGTLKRIWDEHLGFINKSVSDKVKYDCDCHNMGSERTFLRRLELLDALLRINFYTDNFWCYRQDWSVDQFMDEVHEPNSIVGFRSLGSRT